MQSLRGTFYWVGNFIGEGNSKRKTPGSPFVPLEDGGVHCELSLWKYSCLPKTLLEAH